ncbi:hypothetical protein SL034_001573 [Vibrio harveyi]|nr:hypothetical protein [Vibrio harveyi]
MTRKSHEYQGVRGIPAIAKAVGISEVTLKVRVHHKKMTIEEAVALGEAGEKKNPVKYEYQGLRGLINIAEAFGINAKTLENRVITKKMSIEEALNKPVIKHNGDCYLEQQNVEVDKTRALWNVALGMGAQ